ncbi:MAG TPA: hypothetical protein VM598_05380 [Bdellovibrionota bacterium]|nr:hypothetical protein [Bdellovibrionota bacterium]
MMTRTVVLLVTLLLAAPAAAAPRAAITRSGDPLAGPGIPPDPNDPDAFFAGEDLGKYIVVDDLQYPVPPGIDRHPGFTKQSGEAYSAIDPNE